MIQPSPEVVKALAATVRQYPELLAWLADWHQHELAQLPYAKDNTVAKQGRCQVLSEIYKLAKNSPDTAAKQ